MSLLGRQLTIFALPPEQPFDWHRDAASGLEAPRIYGPAIDYRDAGRVGSAKNIWEKGRAHHWPVLALATRQSNGRRFEDELVAQARSWVQDNPFPIGIHWSSALEAGMRLISWVWTERILRGTTAHETLFGQEGILWNEIYWHQWYLARMISGGSSANNHVIGESVGLYLAAKNWPVFRESREWARRSRAIANEAAMAQFFPSGLNAEMGFSYHIYSTELILLAMTEMDRQGESAPEEQWLRMAQAVSMIATLQDAGGNLPRYGDADDAFTLWVEPPGTRREAVLEDLGGRLFGYPSPCQTLGADLIAHGCRVRHIPKAPIPERSFAIEDAGLYILLNRRGSPRELFVICDAGPLGYGRMMAHGHSDALSFTLSVGGHPVLVDPGTGNYHGDPASRLYFRSVQAHNTLSVDKADQAVSRGLFIWQRPYTCNVDGWAPSDAGGLFRASHDGYERLPGRPRHERQLTLNGDLLTVVDQVQGAGEHEVELRFHFHPDCEVRLEGTRLETRGKYGRVRCALDPALEWKLHSGDDVGGWFSPQFGVKIPSLTLVGRVKTKLPFITKAAFEVTNAR